MQQQNQIQNISQSEQPQPLPQPLPQPQPLAHPQTPLLKIHADNTDYKIMCIVRIVIIALILSIFFIRFALPGTYKVLNNEAAFRGDDGTDGSDGNGRSAHSLCNPSTFDAQNKLHCLNFSSSNPSIGLLIPNLLPQNQFTLLYLQLTKYLNNTSTTVLQQPITISLYELTPLINSQTQTKQYFVKSMAYNQTVDYQVSKENYIDFDLYRGPNGERGFIFRLMFAYARVDTGGDGRDYLVVVRFSDYGQIAPGINYMTVQGLTINPAFTRFTIILRSIYCLITLITSTLFLRRYFQLAPQDRILQTRLIAIASVLVPLFNDPLYAVTVLKPNPASVFFSSMFVVVFVVYLQLLWVFFLRRIYYETEEKGTEILGVGRSWMFYLFFLGLFVVTSVLYFQYTYYALYQIPIISYTDISRLKVIPTIVIIVILISVVVIYQLVMLGLILRKYCCRGDNINENSGQQQQERGQLLWRHKNYLLNYPFFLLIFIIFFAAGGSMAYSYEGPWILYGYSFMNIFVIILQFFYYTPAKEMQRHYRGLNGDDHSRLRESAQILRDSSSQGQGKGRTLEKFSVSSDLIGVERQAGMEVEINTNLEEEN